MKRTLITPNIDQFPAPLRSIVQGAILYDSSCSKEAQVFYIDKDKGYYLKKAPLGSLKNQALMTDFFHSKGLGASVITYLSDTEDWLLTERVSGEDCTYHTYLESPKRLCDTIAELLRKLHDTPFTGCPIQDHTKRYLKKAKENHQADAYDLSLFSDKYLFSSKDEAWTYLEKGRQALKCDTLLHGDYCLPNIMLNNWSFSGFIDLGNGGVGDRHVDIFWGIWTLWFNLKTDAYRERFMDAYGRDKIDTNILKTIAAAEVFG